MDLHVDENLVHLAQVMAPVATAAIALVALANAFISRRSLAKQERDALVAARISAIDSTLHYRELRLLNPELATFNSQECTTLVETYRDLANNVYGCKDASNEERRDLCIKLYFSAALVLGHMERRYVMIEHSIPGEESMRRLVELEQHVAVLLREPHIKHYVHNYTKRTFIFSPLMDEAKAHLEREETQTSSQGSFQSPSLRKAMARRNGPLALR
jgi:hypothetical protein